MAEAATTPTETDNRLARIKDAWERGQLDLRFAGTADQLDHLGWLLDRLSAAEADYRKLLRVKSLARHLCRWNFAGAPDYVVKTANELRQYAKINMSPLRSALSSTSAPAGEGAPNASDLYREMSVPDLIREHQALISKKFSAVPPSLSVEDDLRLAAVRFQLDVRREDALSAPVQEGKGQ